MKKIILSTMLMASTLFLTGCFITTAISTTFLLSNDRRSSGEIIDDKGIQFVLLSWTSEDKILQDAHLNFLIYNKTVLVTGEVPTAAALDHLTAQAPSQDFKIKKVINEARVAENSSLFNRIKDSAITAQIETLFLDQEVFNPIHVKITTENRTVYLMGSVTQREANFATKIVSSAQGVKRVVKLFHYLKDRPAAEIKRDKQRKIEAENEAKEAERQRQEELLSPAFNWGK
ncbi:hypothetical protein THERMOT_857 [Bathymodiolus thermophilus thioautotrophic gill symbiont]|uniref:BON domain-containing protein n=1 Tax=Bathymodiolus thermophilus thioautotrophic gill symbiont TaxID=2360 RepID=A0A3G3IQ71_9GAMM|nr:BON domain-containing protein [Bathymodiolus thermophilus thioautotrophic gill symbiont]AYQ57754.1 hypothetical protein MS2017_2101 [Bathymodiolus thermophilus thioautotrophic gill symbiont]CAB5498390.1 hypothetical protein THERMOT_857 [Bathymodiolus thermophilus thioautotrophic gill symbiont]